MAYVRHYNSLIPSQVQQTIYNGDTRLDINAITNYFLGCPSDISYRENLDKWIDVFGRCNVVVRPFDPSYFYNGSLLADFLKSSNLPVNATAISEVRSNQSLGKYTTIFLQKYNQQYPVFINGQKNKKRGRGDWDPPYHVYRNVNDEKLKIKLIYSQEQARKFNEEIDYVNQFFREGYQFHHISPGTGEMVFPTVNEIPVDFFVELINNYNRKLDVFETQDKKLLIMNPEN